MNESSKGFRMFIDISTVEAQELHDMLHQKARVLEETERLCQSINNEFHHLKHEKSKLLSMQSTLERELASSRFTHVQLEEQRSENQRLKEIIGGLQSNLLQADNDQQLSLYDDGLDYEMHDHHGGTMVDDISQGKGCDDNGSSSSSNIKW